MRMLAVVSAALLAGREPPRAAALFVAGALQEWLATGGDLARDYLRVTAPRGSHLQPQVLYERIITDEECCEQDALKPSCIQP